MVPVAAVEALGACEPTGVVEALDGPDEGADMGRPLSADWPHAASNVAMTASDSAPRHGERRTPSLTITLDRRTRAISKELAPKGAGVVLSDINLPGVQRAVD